MLFGLAPRGLFGDQTRRGRFGDELSLPGGIPGGAQLGFPPGVFGRGLRSQFGHPGRRLHFGFLLDPDTVGFGLQIQDFALQPGNIPFDRLARLLLLGQHPGGFARHFIAAHGHFAGDPQHFVLLGGLSFQLRLARGGPGRFLCGHFAADSFEGRRFFGFDGSHFGLGGALARGKFGQLTLRGLAASLLHRDDAFEFLGLADGVFGLSLFRGDPFRLLLQAAGIGFGLRGNGPGLRLGFLAGAGLGLPALPFRLRGGLGGPSLFFGATLRFETRLLFGRSPFLCFELRLPFGRSLLFGGNAAGIGFGLRGNGPGLRLGFLAGAGLGLLALPFRLRGGFGGPSLFLGAAFGF
ncbi:MAG TPA: hypothetical protein P5204_00645 [Kiritimatiellia bacterium]|nr:hypothetical protein [Kiritimatiellia bacterium]